MGKNLTIADVARRARVSIATASRVINNSEHPVSAATRRRVLKAVEQLNFAPSAVARALATRRTRLVGVLVGDTNDPFFSAIVRGVEDVGREQGYLVVVCNSDRVPSVELAYVETLLNHRVDGLILAYGGLTAPGHAEQIARLVERMQRRGAGVIALSQHTLAAPQVTIDNRAAARDMTEHLIALGHRQIALITGPAGLTTTQLRIEGYRAGLEAHGLRYDPARVLPGDFRYESGSRAVEQIFAAGSLPTAIFASNDTMAIGALVALKQRGVRIPADVSLAGMNDLLSARFVEPPLTTVHMPLYDLGALGMRQLLRVLTGEPVEPVRWLEHSIVERQSVGAPRR